MDSPATAAAAHGGLVDDELAGAGLRADEVLDLSVNVNPYGPCPSVQRAIAEAAIDRYPDPSASRARRALGEFLFAKSDRIALGNGAVDLLWLLARACLRPSDRVMTVEPTFSEMARAARQVGAVLLAHRTSARDDFALDLGTLDAHLEDARPRLLYLCSPSNPAGAYVPLRDIEELAHRHPDTLFVCDVSFLSLSARYTADERRSDRLVWVCSLTKDHALPGLRVGYALAPAHIAARLEAERPPWSVNALAQAAAMAVTTSDARRFVDESRACLLHDRAYLEAALAACGCDLRVHPSDTVYCLVDLGPARAATELRRRLLVGHRVLVRDASSFGLPHHVRVAARPRRDVDRLITALNRELHT